jgi:hypothetical protein
MALPIAAAFCGVATSQVVPDVTQIQSGDVFADQVLNVEVATDSTSAVTTATGNSLLGGVVGTPSTATTNQSVSGLVTAQTVLNVSGYSGAETVMTTAATGNTADGTVTGGASFQGTFVQTTSNTVSAKSQVEAETAEAGNISTSAQAIGNSTAYGATSSTINGATGQTLTADVLSDGGAIVKYVSGTSALSAVTVGNNVTATGTAGSVIDLGVSQDSGVGIVQATKFTAYGNSNLTSTTATSTGNNIAMGNQGDSLTLDANQTNGAYVRSQAEETSYDWGGANVTAFGVGNSVQAGNFGREVVLNNNQFNSGAGVESIATFTGHTGYDAVVSATAMGNAATGYACSACGATATISSFQRNTSDVGARTTATFTGQGRNMQGVATAVGNNGTFYTSGGN